MPHQGELWITDFRVLGDSADVLPLSNMNLVQKSNASARLILLSASLLLFAYPRLSIVVTALASLSALALMTKHLQIAQSDGKIKGMLKEGFHSLNAAEVESVKWTKPTINNPLMNVLLPEINDAPNRPKAAPAYNKIIETDVNSKTQQGTMRAFNNDPAIDKRLFEDLGDSLGFDRSMITFNATANTQIPNDQKGFAEFCYGDMPSAKEGTKSALLNNMNPRVIDGDQ
tara:strand:+ start:17306 stop:17992 length:687 start_codon:yes stop_codon:yes gene_type:complete